MGLPPPLAGLAQGGWKLPYNSTHNKLIEAHDKSTKTIDLRFSLGLFSTAEEVDRVVDVLPRLVEKLRGLTKKAAPANV